MKTSNRLFLAGLVGLVACSTQADPFLDDSKSYIRYSNFYWNEAPIDGVSPTREEWVHGVEASFKSGYYKDRIAFDLGVGAANDLYISDDTTSVSNLHVDDDVQSPDGLAKILELYTRIRAFDDDNGSLTVGLGKTTRKTALYSDNRTRIMPASSLGYDLNYKSGELELYFTQVNKFSPRNSSTWGEALKTFENKKIDHLRFGGARYVLPTGTNVQAEYAESADYIRSMVIKADQRVNWDANSSILLSASVGRQQDAGTLFESSGAGPYSADEEHDARFFDLGVKYEKGNYYVGANYNSVSGDDYDRLFFSADHGHWDSSAKLFYWFGLEGENTFKLSAGMNFADLGLSQLRWDGHYAVSRDANGFSEFDRSEWQSLVQYRFTGALEGLHFIWLHTEHDAQATPDGVQRSSLPFTPAGIFSQRADRVFVNYVHQF